MLPLATLLFLAPLGNAQILPRSGTATHIETLTTLIPPYGSTAASGWGAPTFYASVSSINPSGTIFAITCHPPTSTPRSATGPEPDPCHIKDWGTGSLTFLQESDTWAFTRTKSGRKIKTECGVFLGNCYTGGETYAQMTDLGLVAQKVLVTGGWELVEYPGGVPSATTAGAIGSFTDIGASNTKGAPVTTVTLLKTPGESGAARTEVLRAVCVAAFVTVLAILVV